MSSALPPLYAAWIEEFLGKPIPPETEATCQDCAMLAGPEEKGDGDLQFFDPTTRCCTYLPDLPNFLVGPILCDEEPRLAAGRRSVEERLGRRVAVSPLGLGWPETYALLYRNSRDGFGASRALRCPHHADDGSCGIWPHRMSVCATWFCKYSRGAVGQRFWRELQVLLKVVEQELARWCLLQLRLDARALARLFPPPDPVPDLRTLDRFQLDGQVDPDAYAAGWGNWAGREHEFYTACGRLAAGLKWQQVLDICGPRARIAAELTSEAFRALRSRALPARLKPGSFHLLRLSEQGAIAVSYSGGDPLHLSRELLAALPYFDGRPVAAAVRAIAREQNLHLEAGLLRKLVDFEVLLPV